MGATKSDHGATVICANGSLYVQGFFRDTVDFDPAPNEINLVDTGGGDIFIARYDLNGHYLWAGNLGVTEYGNILGMVMDKADNLYTAGIFRGTIDLDPGTAEANVTMSSFIPRIGLNAFVVKLNAGCERFLGHTEANCDSFTFNGNAYMASGTYRDTFLASNACDSISTLYLTITGKTSVNEKVTALYCDSVSFNGIIYKTSGVYTQHYSAITGCDSSFTYDLTINPAPRAGINRDGIVLTADGTGSYQWINCDGNSPIDGATAQQYIPSVTGSYAVVVTAAGCSDTSRCITVTDPTAIHGPDKNNKLKVYPNPVTDHLTIETSQAWNNATIRVLNTIGQSMSEYTNVKGSLLTVNMATYPAGIYIVEIREGREAARMKITKK